MPPPRDSLATPNGNAVSPMIIRSDQSLTFDAPQGGRVLAASTNVAVRHPVEANKLHYVSFSNVTLVEVRCVQ